MKCLVFGCSNHDHQGRFIGSLCAPCHEYLSTGKIGPTDSFLGKLRDLPKAIFAAGFRAGYAAGNENAVAYEWGESGQGPRRPQEAWGQDVQWRIDTDGSYRLDVLDPEAWEGVP